jgi:hypothetical protein
MNSECRGRQLGAKQIQVRNDSNHRLQHVRAIVYEVGDADLSAMHGFLRTLATETHIVAVDAGSLKEAVVVEPLHVSILNASTALGDNPDGLNHAQGSQEQTPMDDRSWPAALDMLGALSARSGP